NDCRVTRRPSRPGRTACIRVVSSVDLLLHRKAAMDHLCAMGASTKSVLGRYIFVTGGRRRRTARVAPSHGSSVPLPPGDKAMTAYIIADIKITDDAWVPGYAGSVHDIVHKHGGKYLSRSGNVKTLEGKPLDTTVIALMAFPSAKAAEAFVADPMYAPYVTARQRGSESRFQLIDDSD